MDTLKSFPNHFILVGYVLPDYFEMILLNKTNAGVDIFAENELLSKSYLHDFPNTEGFLSTLSVFNKIS